MARRPMPSGAEIADNFAKGMASKGVSNYKKGVTRMTENPAQKAIAKKEKLKNNFIAAVDNGKWERGLQKVTLDGIKQAMLGKGANNLASGAAAAQPKLAAYYNATRGQYEAILNEIYSMPNDTYAERKARASAWSDLMHQMAETRGT